MHPNPVFRKESEGRAVQLLEERAFGTLAINHEDGPLLSHVPFRLSDDQKLVELHLVRSNPIVRLLASPQPAVISVTGPDVYVSPDWYGIPDQVPTWNYVAVHVRGMLERMADEELHGVLERLSHSMETRLLPKKPWTSAKMDQNVYHRMIRQIVPVRLKVNTIESTWKLSQNKPGDVRLSAADGVNDFGFGSETKAMANLMKNVDD